MFSHGRSTRTESGVALLIAIFSLVLISAVAVSLILMAGTESAINANYRRATSAFFAGQAGLEEARERLVVNAPDTVRNLPAFPNANVPNVVTGQVLYIMNPAPADPAYNPQTDPPTTPYFDAEYQQEFGIPPLANPNQLTNSSAMATAGNLPPLPYKWVRVTLKSEAMGGIDLNGDGVLDPVTPLRAQASNNQCLPGMLNCSTAANQPVTTMPVYRLTALSLEPGGGRRLLQAEVAEMPEINPIGAIASEAGVNINGNFNAFGSWPPVVTESCSSGKGPKTTKTTCGNYVGGQVVGDCNNLYDPVTDTCNGVPRSHNDYCNLNPAVDGVASAGSVSSGNYDEVPDNQAYCTTNGPGCIFTVSPQEAIHEQINNWPYDMNLVIDMLKPPITEPVTNISGVTCSSWDSNGDRTCQGQDVQMGTLPSPWPPLPNVQQLNNQPRFLYAEVGRSGSLKLTGASSGSGMLIVDGDLQINAGFQWYGLILVRGVVTFLGGGSTPTNVFGGVIAGKSVTNASTTTGGSVSVIFSSCAYRFNNQSMPLRYLSFREIVQ